MDWTQFVVRSDRRNCLMGDQLGGRFRIGFGQSVEGTLPYCSSYDEVPSMKQNAEKRCENGEQKFVKINKLNGPSARGDRIKLD